MVSRLRAFIWLESGIRFFIKYETHYIDIAVIGDVIKRSLLWYLFSTFIFRCTIVIRFLCYFRIFRLD